MSRVGRLPIAIPAGVEVKCENNNVTVKGPLGEATRQFSEILTIEVKDGEITVTRPNDTSKVRALHGLTRALLQNMVTGVSKGFAKELEIIGVGYRVAMDGTGIVLNVGYSHPINIAAIKGITFEVPNPNSLIVKGADKHAVGEVAAEIRRIRPPEPYKGKGIKYKDEVIRRKEGKTGM